MIELFMRGLCLVFGHRFAHTRTRLFEADVVCLRCLKESVIPRLTDYHNEAPR